MVGCRQPPSAPDRPSAVLGGQGGAHGGATSVPDLGGRPLCGHLCRHEYRAGPVVGARQHLIPHLASRSVGREHGAVIGRLPVADRIQDEDAFERSCSGDSYRLRWASLWRTKARSEVPRQLPTDLRADLPRGDPRRSLRSSESYSKRIRHRAWVSSGTPAVGASPYANEARDANNALGLVRHGWGPAQAPGAASFCATVASPQGHMGPGRYIRS